MCELGVADLKSAQLPDQLYWHPSYVDLLLTIVSSVLLRQADDLGVVSTATCWEHGDQWQYMTACEQTRFSNVNMSAHGAAVAKRTLYLSGPTVPPRCIRPQYRTYVQQKDDGYLESSRSTNETFQRLLLFTRRRPPFLQVGRTVCYFVNH